MPPKSERRRSSSPKRRGSKGKGRRGSGGSKGKGRRGSKGRRKSSKSTTNTLEKSTLANMKDKQLEQMLKDDNEDHFVDMFALNKKTEDVSKKVIKCTEGLAELGRVLSQSQTGLIVERLKKQISDSFAEFQRKTKAKQSEINSLALENSYQVEVNLLAKMNNESASIRDEILHSCSDCKRKVVERVEGYCNILKYMWERQAADVISEQRWSQINDSTDDLKRQIIEDSLREMQKTSEKFELESEKLTNCYRDQRKTNENVAHDYFMVLKRLNKVRETYDRTRNEVQACLELQKMPQVEKNAQEIQRLQKQLKEWNRKVSFRERQKADETTLQQLNRALAQEGTTKARMNLRVKQLKDAMDYTMESFKYSNQVHSDYLKEVNEKTIPELFETTKKQAKELMNAEVLGVNPLKRQLEKQKKCLIAKRTEGIMMAAEQMKLLEENTSITANLNYLDNAIARTESDLKSSKLECDQVTDSLKNLKEEIEEMEIIRAEGTRIVNRINGLTRSVQLTIPGMDRQRMQMVQRKQDCSSKLSEIRVTLNKLSEMSSGDTMWQLIRELDVKWLKDQESFPELNSNYQKKQDLLEKAEFQATRVLKQAFLLTQRKAADNRKTI